MSLGFLKLWCRVDGTHGSPTCCISTLPLNYIPQPASIVLIKIAMGWGWGAEEVASSSQHLMLLQRTQSGFPAPQLTGIFNSIPEGLVCSYYL